MLTLLGTLFAIGLVAGAAACAGKSKAATTPDTAVKDDAAQGGSTYGGDATPDDPCGAAKSDPCGGAE